MRKNFINVILFSLIFCLVTLNLVYSEVYIEYDLYDIIDNFVNSKNFYVAGFDNSSENLLAIAPINDVSLKKQNKNYRLYFLGVNEKKVKQIDIPMYGIQQFLFDKNNEKLFLIGNKLTTLAVVDMKDLKYKELSKVEYGKNSFRFFGLIWYENDDIFTAGYYLDKKQNSTDDFIVRIVFDNDNIKFVNTGFNITNFEKKFNPKNMVILNHENIAFISEKQKGLYIGIVNKNMEMKMIDQADTFSGLSFSDNFILYGKKQSNKIFFCLYDYRNNKFYLQKEIDFPPSYNFISDNSQAIILGNFKPKTGKMDVYIGKADSNYELNKVIDNDLVGYMKISPDGKYFAYVQKTGKIRVYKI